MWCKQPLLGREIRNGEGITFRASGNPPDEQMRTPPAKTTTPIDLQAQIAYLKRSEELIRASKREGRMRRTVGCEAGIVVTRTDDHVGRRFGNGAHHLHQYFQQCNFILPLGCFVYKKELPQVWTVKLSGNIGGKVELGEMSYRQD